MRKSKLDSISLFKNQNRSFKILIVSLLLIYSFFLFFCEFRFLSSAPAASSAAAGGAGAADRLLSQQNTDDVSSPFRPYRLIKSSFVSSTPPSYRVFRSPRYVSSLKFSDLEASRRSGRNFSELQKSAKEAFDVGRKIFHDLDSVSSGATRPSTRSKEEEKTKCPHSVTLTGVEFKDKGNVMVIPCGLTLGSHVTLVGRPHQAHPEHDPKIAIVREEDEPVMVSQFMMELQGLKTVDGEDPPRILHFNPRLKGDWSGKPVIEQNTCYRMQWGTAQRCEGWKSRADEETGMILNL